jgi:hypothetical protein
LYDNVFIVCLLKSHSLVYPAAPPVFSFDLQQLTPAAPSSMPSSASASSTSTSSTSSFNQPKPTPQNQPSPFTMGVGQTGYGQTAMMNQNYPQFSANMNSGFVSTPMQMNQNPMQMQTNMQMGMQQPYPSVPTGQGFVQPTYQQGYPQNTFNPSGMQQQQSGLMAINQVRMYQQQQQQQQQHQPRFL